MPHTLGCCTYSKFYCTYIPPPLKVKAHIGTPSGHGWQLWFYYVMTQFKENARDKAIVFVTVPPVSGQLATMHMRWASSLSDQQILHWFIFCHHGRTFTSHLSPKSVTENGQWYLVSTTVSAKGWGLTWSYQFTGETLDLGPCKLCLEMKILCSTCFCYRDFLSSSWAHPELGKLC